MKIKVTGQAMTITAGVKLAAIKDLKQDFGYALTISDENTGEHLYGIAAGSEGSINANGAVFNAADADGYAQMTVKFPSVIAADKREAYVRKNYGQGIALLKTHEETIVKQMGDVVTSIDEAMDAVEVD